MLKTRHIDPPPNVASAMAEIRALKERAKGESEKWHNDRRALVKRIQEQAFAIHGLGGTQTLHQQQFSKSPLADLSNFNANVDTSFANENISGSSSNINTSVNINDNSITLSELREKRNIVTPTLNRSSAAAVVNYNLHGNNNYKSLQQTAQS